jgi:branched-chain amino acid transport system ATP-binding protein
VSGAAGLLQAEGIGVDFAGVKALADVTLAFEQGEILGLIGPNGAGKTTLVNVLSGFQQPTQGSVHLAERDVTGWAPQKLASNGLGRTFQSVRLFGRMTVVDNVLSGAVAGGMRMRAARTFAWDLLERMQLTHAATVLAEALPHGEERRLGIIRALAARPAFLLLDEPAAGLNEHETERLKVLLSTLPHDFEVGLLVIEHDMPLVLGLCHRIHVLDYGRTIAEGTPEEIRHNPAVIEAYLGTAANATG